MYKPRSVVHMTPQPCDAMQVVRTFPSHRQSHHASLSGLERQKDDASLTQCQAL